MPTVANLAVSVTANTSAFNRKMQNAASIVTRFGRAVVGVGRRLFAFNTAMRAIKLVGVTLATRYILKFAEATIVTARKIGLTTDELLGLQFAANLAGIKTKELTERLERIVPKLGTIQDALRSMGVSAGALADMVRVLEAIGGSMTQFQSRAVEGAIKAVRALWATIKAASLELAIRLAPAIKWVAEELLHFVVMARIAVVELGKRLEPHIQRASEYLVQFATAGASAGVTLPKSFGLIAEAGAKLANALAFIEAAWHGLNATVLKVTSGMLHGFDVGLQALRHFVGEIVAGIEALFPLLPAGFLPPMWKELLAGAKAYQAIVTTTQAKIAGLTRTLATDATEAVEKMNKAWDKFKQGKYGDDFKAAFEDIAKRAAEVVAQILKLQKIGLKIPDIPSAARVSGATGRARTAEFQQITSRVALAGINTPSRPQIVRDPQLETTNEYLRRIRAAIAVQYGLTS